MADAHAHGRDNMIPTWSERELTLSAIKGAIMSFSKAIAAFKENEQKVLSINSGLARNTNAGLLNLTEAVQGELRNIELRLERIEQILERLEPKQ